MPVAADSLHAVLDRLADYESDSGSVVSVYLDLKPAQPYKSFLIRLLAQACHVGGDAQVQSLKATTIWLS